VDECKPLDDGKAGEYYQRAADLAQLDAMTNIGFLFEKGLGVTRDLDAALHFYRAAAARGYAKAQNNLGSMYYSGSGVVGGGVEGQ